MKIWIVNLESNVDGEVMFEAIPCASKEAARRVLKEEKEYVLEESHHWSKYADDFDERIDTEDHFYINDPFDSYYEDYTIEEKEVVEE